jgi:hypothetical protein
MADDQNVAEGIVKARAAGYSDDEIASHLAEKLPGIKGARDAGYSSAEILSHLSKSPEAAPSVAEDVAKAGAVGLAKGATIDLAGMPGDIAQLAKAGVDYVGSKLPDIPSPSPDSYIGKGLQWLKDQSAPYQHRAASGDLPGSYVPPTSAQLQGSVEKVTGPLYEAKTLPGKIVGTGTEMAANLIGGPESLGQKLLTRIAAPTAAITAADEATDGNPLAKLAAPVAASVLAHRLTSRRPVPIAPEPTTEDAFAAARQDFNSPEVKDLRVTPQSMGTLSRNIGADLEQQGFFPETNPRVYAVLDRIENRAGPAPVPFDYLEGNRRALGHIAGEVGPDGRATPDARAASQAIDRINHFVENDMANPANVLQGDPVAAAQALRRGQANYGAASRSERANVTLDNATIDAAAAHSGTNIMNRIRQAFKPMLKNDASKARGYNDAELNSLDRLVRGTRTLNSVRQVSNWLGGSGISAPIMASIGASAFGPIGAAAPVGGLALKALANHLTTRQAQNLSTQLLSRAPVVQQMLAANRAARFTNAQAARAVTTRGLLHGALAATLASKVGRKTHDE